MHLKGISGENMNTKTYNIPAINCMHCVHTIKNELSEMKGVQYVEGNHEEKKVTVTFEDPATSENIEILLAEIGYPVAN
jgi:copper chaperone CopZ